MSHSSILNSFDQDQLNRKPLADYLTSFINTAIPTTNEKSVVIALDSPWGSGKSSFINMWTDSLNNEEFVYVNYNAWENDDFEDALTPIICCLWEKTGCKSYVNFIEILTVFGKNILGEAIQAKIGINPIKCAEKSMAMIDENECPDVFNRYTSRQNKKDLFSDLIDNIRGNRKKVIICIDELDRCRPTFAIETLEVIKHFFDIEYLIFVFTLDMNQLKKTIQIIYGDIECTAYLQRFFDYQLTFTEPDLEDYLYSRLVDVNGGTILDIDFAIDAAKFFSLSLRTLNVICEEFQKFIKQKLTFTKNKVQGPSEEFRRTYFVFFCLKYSNPMEYYNYVNNGIPERPGMKFWNDFFLDQEPPRLPVSWYPKRFAEHTLSELWDDSESNGDKELWNVAYQHLIYDKEYRVLYSELASKTITLKQIIKNNIEYNVMFPNGARFALELEMGNKQLP